MLAKGNRFQPWTKLNSEISKFPKQLILKSENPNDAWPWILVLPFDHVIGQEISLHSITNEMVIFPALSYTHFIYLDLSLAPRDDYFKSDLLWYHSY